MKEIRAAAGQRVAAIRRAFSSVPVDYRFGARSVNSGHAISGTVEVRKSRWILPGVPVSQPLRSENVVSAGLWNTFMSVDVIAEADLVILTEGRVTRHGRTILVTAVVIVLIAAVLMATLGR